MSANPARRVVRISLAALMSLLLVVPAAAARKLLKLEVTESGRTAKVEVPRGVETVALQQFQKTGGWTRVAEKAAEAGVMRFRLPGGGEGRWRAIGRFASASGDRGKFPAAFYQGDHRFSAGRSTWAVGPWAGRIAGFESESPDSAAPPEEADIWKIDGGTVYFFNQLRGLQVVDVRDPADPRLIASLRMPAMGEDLFLLPGSGATRHVVLLTRTSKDNTLISIVRVDSSGAAVVRRERVKGSLGDSRMVGNRLILATSEWREPEEKNGGWTTLTRVSEWFLNGGAAPVAGAHREIEGSEATISAGSGWLAVSVVPNGRWNRSEVSVFSLDSPGLRNLTAAPVRTAGSIQDTFKIQWRDDVLTTISERSTRTNRWRPETVLETFHVPATGAAANPRLGKLSLAKGESLYATRFAGHLAYIVTFLQTDPLWVVDLTDPSKPAVAGHIEVPGWSTHLEPVGDSLFSIGWDNGTVVASLFDVSDPAAPALRKRLKLGPRGTFSEAAWDRKALRVLPDDGLALVPVGVFEAKNGTTRSEVRLLDFDPAAGTLEMRGAIQHDFDPRRAELLKNSVVSVSQRVMVTADVADPDRPEILSEVSLAWPVDRVLDAGPWMLQIEAGTAWSVGRATLRVSPAEATEEIHAEHDLGSGQVKAADLRDGMLYVLREAGPPTLLAKRSVVTGRTKNRLVLDVYDASALPALERIGRRVVHGVPGLTVNNGRLLWPQANRPVALLEAEPRVWVLYESMRSAEPVASVADLGRVARRSIVSDWAPRRAARLVAFDVSDPRNPTADEPARVGIGGTVPNGTIEAAGGLVAIGTESYRRETNGKSYPDGRSMQGVHVFEIGASGAPAPRPMIDLPDPAFAITELEEDGFLVFTAGAKGVKVCASDGYDAFKVALLEVEEGRAMAASERRLFVAAKDGIEQFRLEDDGSFTPGETIASGFRPWSLRCVGRLVLASNGNKLFAAGRKKGEGTKWKFPTWWLDLRSVETAADGDLLVPFGEYGVERLDR
ncbi:MAG: beta-propeller domain-containing protein [Akkermansiaceae bacterium]|nr:beta-propeller domain-containing protein [Akkermansiaceae bacterium]